MVQGSGIQGSGSGQSPENEEIPTDGRETVVSPGPGEGTVNHPRT